MGSKKKLVPPDGGWGWMVVIAYAINNLVFIPILQSFGLIFKDVFSGVDGLSAADGSTIININAAFGMLMGLVNGALLRKFGYRKVSVTGSVFMIFGIISTAFANSFVEFVVSYGLITSIGMGMGMASYSLALNTYFVKNRGKATGISFTITGLGPIFMPQLITFLMFFYGVRGTMLIMGAISSHTMIAALLLQPVKWHMIEEEEEKQVNESDTKEKEHEIPLLKSDSASKIGEAWQVVSVKIESKSPINHAADKQQQSNYQLEPTPISLVSQSEGTGKECPSDHEPRTQSPCSITNHNQYKGLVSQKSSESCKKDQQTSKIKNDKSHLQTLVDLFDLSLLKDLTFVNIMCGISFATFAELNFTMLTPFILNDLGLSTRQIATFMSSLALADILFRFLSPFIGGYFKKSPRVMYIVTMILLIFARYSLLIAPSYGFMLVVAAVLGMTKGVRTVYVSLVIPAHVPIERLASASGLQMMLNGCLFLLCGPSLGVIKDVTGNYSQCIYALNLVTFMTIALWTVEMTYTALRKKKRKDLPEEAI